MAGNDEISQSVFKRSNFIHTYMTDNVRQELTGALIKLLSKAGTVLTGVSFPYGCRFWLISGQMYRDIEVIRTPNESEFHFYYVASLHICVSADIESVVNEIYDKLYV